MNHMGQKGFYRVLRFEGGGGQNLENRVTYYMDDSLFAIMQFLIENY
jgi:hypothetical protein